MAENVDKNSVPRRKERDSFLEDLKRFHNNRGTPFRHFPSLRGHEVDLYLLYNKVTALGGWEKVNEAQRWDQIETDFHLPKGCTNAAQALRDIYIRYLDVYEKINFFGEDPSDRKIPESEEQTLPGQRKKINYASIVPSQYNHPQHYLSASLRETMGLCKFVEPGMADKITKSLMSGLPNEMDFAVNICTLLSSEGKHTLQLERCPRLLTLLLAHIGICETGPGSLKNLHLEGWKPAQNRNYFRFWWDSVVDHQDRKLICPDTPLPEQEENGPSISDVLCLERDLGLNDKEGQRVLQISMIIRNLSFEPENMKILASDNLVLRFLMLCMKCKYHSIRQLALDTLGNISVQMGLKSCDRFITSFILSTLTTCIQSSDKFEVVTGLDMLSRLCQVEDGSNEDIICERLPLQAYKSIVSYLTVHDIQLIVYTLECLYQLSELGEITTTHIASVTRAVSSLVSLVTIEAQSYGPESIKGIKVVEHIPAGMTGSSTSHQPVEASTSSVKTPHKQANATPLSAIKSHTLSTPIPSTKRPPVNATPPPHSRPTPPPPPNDMDPQLCTWLQCNYEAADGYTVSQMEVYSSYLKVFPGAAKKVFDHGVGRNMNMAFRLSFPRVELKKIQADGKTDTLCCGIKKRDVPISLSSGMNAMPPPRPPTPQSPQATTASMLQQVLMNKMGANTHIGSPAHPPQSLHQNQQQQPNLIKTLLASKVQQSLQQGMVPPQQSASGSSFNSSLEVTNNNIQQQQTVSNSNQNIISPTMGTVQGNTNQGPVPFASYSNSPPAKIGPQQMPNSHISEAPSHQQTAQFSNQNVPQQQLSAMNPSQYSSNHIQTQQLPSSNMQGQHWPQNQLSVAKQNLPVQGQFQKAQTEQVHGQMVPQLQPQSQQVNVVNNTLAQQEQIVLQNNIQTSQPQQIIHGPNPNLQWQTNHSPLSPNVIQQPQVNIGEQSMQSGNQAPNQWPQQQTPGPNSNFQSQFLQFSQGYSANQQVPESSHMSSNKKGKKKNKVNSKSPKVKAKFTAGDNSSVVSGTTEGANVSATLLNTITSNDPISKEQNITSNVVLETHKENHPPIISSLGVQLGQFKDIVGNIKESTIERVKNAAENGGSMETEQHNPTKSDTCDVRSNCESTKSNVIIGDSTSSETAAAPVSIGHVSNDNTHKFYINTSSNTNNQAHCDMNQSLSKSTSGVIATHANGPSSEKLTINCGVQSSQVVTNGSVNTSPIVSPRDLSPYGTSTVEEKKARIAQLMKDTKRIKEQMMGMNGVCNHLENSSQTIQRSDNTITPESQGSNSKDYGNTSSAGEGGYLSNQQSLVNGFPEQTQSQIPVNGNHRDSSSINVTNAKTVINSSDLSSSETSVIDTRTDKTDNVVSMEEDLNTNNNCNDGGGDSGNESFSLPPSPAPPVQSFSNSANNDNIQVPPSNSVQVVSSQSVSSNLGESIVAENMDTSDIKCSTNIPSSSQHNTYLSLSTSQQQNLQTAMSDVYINSNLLQQQLYSTSSVMSAPLQISTLPQSVQAFSQNQQPSPINSRPTIGNSQPLVMSQTLQQSPLNANSYLMSQSNMGHTSMTVTSTQAQSVNTLQNSSTVVVAANENHSGNIQSSTMQVALSQPLQLGQQVLVGKMVHGEMQPIMQGLIQGSQEVTNKPQMVQNHPIVQGQQILQKGQNVVQGQEIVVQGQPGVVQSNTIQGQSVVHNNQVLNNNQHVLQNQPLLQTQQIVQQSQLQVEGQVIQRPAVLQGSSVVQHSPVIFQDQDHPSTQRQVVVQGHQTMQNQQIIQNQQTVQGQKVTRGNSLQGIAPPMGQTQQVIQSPPIVQSQHVNQTQNMVLGQSGVQTQQIVQSQALQNVQATVQPVQGQQMLHSPMPGQPIVQSPSIQSQMIVQNQSLQPMVQNQLEGQGFVQSQPMQGQLIVQNQPIQGQAIVQSMQGQTNVQSQSVQGQTLVQVPVQGSQIVQNQPMQGTALFQNPPIQGQDIVQNLALQAPTAVHSQPVQGNVIIQSVQGQLMVQSPPGQGQTMVSSQPGQGQLLVQNQAGQGQLIVQNKSGQGELMIPNQSGQGQIIVQNQPGQGQIMVQNQSGQGQLVVQNQPGQGQIMVQNQPGQGQVIVQTQPGPGQFMVQNQSGQQGQIMVQNQPGHGQIMVQNQPVHGQQVVQASGQAVFKQQNIQGKSQFVQQNQAVVQVQTTLQNQTILKGQQMMSNHSTGQVQPQVVQSQHVSQKPPFIQGQQTLIQGQQIVQNQQMVRIQPKALNQNKQIDQIVFQNSNQSTIQNQAQVQGQVVMVPMQQTPEGHLVPLQKPLGQPVMQQIISQGQPIMSTGQSLMQSRTGQHTQPVAQGNQSQFVQNSQFIPGQTSTLQTVVNSQGQYVLQNSQQVGSQGQMMVQVQLPSPAPTPPPASPHSSVCSPLPSPAPSSTKKKKVPTATLR